MAQTDFDPVGIREIAERLGVQRQTVAMWNLRGMLPETPHVVSGAPCWRWSDVEKWAKETGRA